MIVELELKMKTDLEDQEIVQSIALPDGWMPTGGTLFFEKKNGQFHRFSFRVDNADAEPEIVVTEEGPEPNE